MNHIHLIINIEQHTRRVLQVGLSPTPLVIPDPGRLNLVSPISDWLYLALTGHAYDQPPFHATFYQANAARAHILARQHTKPAWRIAQEVINQWGHYIRPWFGCLIQQDGQVVEDAKEYHLLYNLATGKEISPVEQNFLWVGER